MWLTICISYKLWSYDAPFMRHNFFSILAWSWWQWTGKRRIWLNHSKGHWQGQVWLIFTYFSILISSIEVLPKCIASCSFSEVILVLFSNFNGDWFQMLFSRSENPIWTFVNYLANLSETVHAVTNVCMKDIYKVIYDLSVYLVIFDNLHRSNQGHRPFKGLCPINGASYHQSLYEIHSVIYGLSAYLRTFHLWWNWKGKSRSLGFQRTLFHRRSMY